MLFPVIATAARAQTAQFTSAQSTIGSGLNSPFDVAVDGSGNVYIADSGNNRVLKETLSGGSYTQSTVADASTNGLNSPTGVAADGSGNVYIADNNNNRVLKETLSGGTYTQSIIASGLFNPISVAVDSSGNVYIVDPGNNRVLKETLSGGSYTQSTVANASTNGLNSPTAVAVDGSGNVYIADNGNSRVLKETLSGGAYTQSTVVSGVGPLDGVAVDGSGNVYITEYTLNVVLKETLSGGSYTQSTLADASMNGLNTPAGMAVDNSGNVYIADDGNHRVLKLQFAAVDFGSAAIGANAAVTFAFTFTNSTAATIGTPVVLTQGATGLDFADAGTGSCDTNGTSHSYISGNTCTVAVNFNPQYAGARDGAVELTNSSGAVIATAYVYGAGTGPQVTFAPAVQSTVFDNATNGLSQPYNLAVGGSGNVYIADAANNRVLKETLSGGLYTQTTVASGLNSPQGVAVDGSGNVYIADTFNNRVLKETLSGGSYTQSTVADLSTNGLQQPFAVAVDGSGNVYISDSLRNRVLKGTPSGGSYTSSTVVSGLGILAGIAVDGSGDVYVADDTNNVVLKETPSGGSYTQSVVADASTNGLNAPEGLAVDGSGNNVYIADYNNNRVLKETLSGSSYTQTTVAGSLNQPIGVAVDGSGNVYIGDRGLSKVLLEDVATPPSLSFASTVVYSGNSSDSPKTVTLSNIGNATLNFPLPTTAGAFNPSVSANFTWDSRSSCQQTNSGTGTAYTLQTGASCTVAIDFAPAIVGSSIPGSVTLTDNTRNNLGVTPPANATQTISLSGAATQASQTITFANPGTQTYGASPTLAATASSGLAVSFTSATASVCTVTTGGALSVVALGTCTMDANQAGNTDYTAAPTVSQSFTVAMATPSVTAWPAASAITYGQTLSASHLTGGSVSNNGSIVPGTFALVTPTAAPGSGTASESVIFTPTDTTDYTTVTGSVNVTVNPAPLTITAANATMTYGGTLPSVTSTIAGLVNGDTSSALGAITCSASTTTLKTTCSGAVDANYTITYASGTLTVNPAPLTITAANATMTYGGSAPSVTATISGLVNGDTSSALGAITCTASTTTLKTTCSGAVDANYTITYASGTLTITPAPLTITASNATMTYGGSVPSVTSTISGLVNGDTSSALGAITCSASTTTRKTTCSGAVDANYTITYASGTLTVNKATLTVTAAPVSIAYGSAVPAFSPSYSGFVNGDTAASALTGAPTLTTTATSKSGAGTYPIAAAAGTLAAANYSFTFAGSTLTVTPAAQTITFSTISTQAYGAAPLTLAATASSGLPVTFVLVSGPATLSGDTLTLTGGGTVATEATQAGNNDYQAATPVTRTFLVTAPGLTISPSTLAFGGELTGSTSAAQTVTLTNTGTSTLTIASLAASGGFAETSGCAATLAAGAHCTAQVTYTPAVVGSSSGALTVTTNASPATATVALSGSGENLLLAPGANPPPIVTPGQPALFALSITPSGGLTGGVGLACAVKPATQVSCSLAPTSLTLSGASPETISVVANTAAGAAGWALPGAPGSPNAWLQLGGALSVSGRTLPAIEARTPSDQRERPGQIVASPWPLWMLAALALLAGLAFALRRRRSHWAALVFGAALLLAACGTPPAALNPSAGSTPAGNYVLTVTATAAGGSRTAQLPFTVR
ncbi:MAG: choice-of-anchor D domain-containing protein [Acidobacteria bacterium]|nr:MAG: choice-of-anchor D domain-containing protein [Acidobacteriota bacterium]